MFGDQYTPYILTNKKLEIVISFFGIAALLGLISLFWHYTKPTYYYVEQTKYFAIFFAAIALLTIGVYIYQNYQFNQPSGKAKRNLLIASFLITSSIPWGVYHSVSGAVPMIIHPLSSQQTAQIEVFVTDKEYSRSRYARMGLFCEYEIIFEHPNIPQRNYLCTSKSAWDQISVNSFIQVTAQRSKFAYSFKKIERLR